MIFREELRLTDIGCLIFKEIAELIRQQRISFEDLSAMGFNPYFPLGSLELKHFNKFSREGYDDVCLICEEVLRNVNDLGGVKAVSITGSAAVGLANEYPFSCEKERRPNGYSLSQAPGGSSDIDVEVLVSGERMEEIKDLFAKISLRLRESDMLHTPPGQINFAFYPIEHILNSLSNDPYSSCLVRFGVWSNARLILHGEDVIQYLRGIAQDKVMSDSETAKFFWGNLADRYLFHQYRLLVKAGIFRSIFVSSEEVPTLFDEKVRASKMSNTKIAIGV